MEVNDSSRIIFLLQIIYEASCHVLAEPYVITAAAPLPVTTAAVWLSVFQFYATTSGDFVLSALLRDLVCNGGSADGV